MKQITIKLLIINTLSLAIFFTLLKAAEPQPIYVASDHKLKENQINIFTEEDLSDTILINKLNNKKEEQEKKYIEQFTFEATAYTAFCNTGCIGITRTGYDVSNTIHYEDMRIIAVDPKVIPLHSIVEVDTGEKVFTAIALDTGGAIKNDRIDILMSTKEKAFKFGRRDVEVKILEWGGG